ncbi:cobalamin biosynthesis protein [Thalassotalea euphylliae]|uniref:cobalamin biosynthesis protein CobD/CbiB n=1 Tax=Thalassotalea euphylliae TaxID=1655234 RepID=UPI00363EA488
MDLITSLPPQLHGITILVVVMLVKRILQGISPHEPFIYFRFFCQQLALKVNKSENGSRQQTISGFVAVLITFAPLWVILWLFADFVQVEALWQALLLYFALGELTLKPTANKVVKTLSAGDKYQAKQLLADQVLRDTEQLSPLGINKATIEMLILRHMQQTVAVSFLFLLGGGLLAISYRLILEMHYSWNQKITALRAFGQFAKQLTELFTWLPCRFMLLAGLFLSFGQQSTLLWRMTMPDFFKLNNHALLQFFAIALNVRLAGVAMYKGIKVRRRSFNDNGKQPEIKDIVSCHQFLSRINTLLAMLAIALVTLPWLASYTY